MADALFVLHVAYQPRGVSWAGIASKIYFLLIIDFFDSHVLLCTKSSTGTTLSIQRIPISPTTV